MFNLFKPVTKPPAPKPQTPKQTTNWDVSKAYNQRPEDFCFIETDKDGKQFAFTLINPAKLR